MIPDNMKFTKEHEWVQLENDIATIGITDFAQSELGDIVYLELPEAGSSVNASDEIGVVESVKTVSNIYSPLSGEILEINSAAVDAPETLNESPYGDGWLLKLKINDSAELTDLLNPDEYKGLIE